MHLDSKQNDRAVGVLVAQAGGDALGVPYEYGSRALTGEPQMLGGGLGGIAPGQWSDDTEMAVCIAEVAATGADLRTDEALERIAQGFLRWYGDSPPDVGIQTRHVLGETARSGEDATTMLSVSAELHARTGRTAGNGSLMRTGPVALAHLGDRGAIGWPSCATIPSYAGASSGVVAHRGDPRDQRRACSLLQLERGAGVRR